MANKNNPIACLNGDAGSRFLLPNPPQIQTKMGANITIATALILWKYDAGTMDPNKLRSVCSSAK